jgi:hypothetical protein
MSFVYVRGNGAKHRVMHLASYDRLGNMVGALCGNSLPFNTSCNLPLGRPICKKCLAEETRIRRLQP